MLSDLSDARDSRVKVQLKVAWLLLVKVYWRTCIPQVVWLLSILTYLYWETLHYKYTLAQVPDFAVPVFLGPCGGLAYLKYMNIGRRWMRVEWSWGEDNKINWLLSNVNVSTSNIVICTSKGHAKKGRQFRGHRFTHWTPSGISHLSLHVQHGANMLLQFTH